MIEQLDEMASRLAGVERRQDGGSVIFLRASQPFAVVEGDSVAFRLDPLIAAAAAATPDAAPSPRGKEWVQFSPRELDRFATDRATAWFESAWRRAGG